MTQVDFYILAAQTLEERALFACRLAEKAFSRGNRVLIQTDTEASARALDDLLWTFRDDAFIPHALLNASDAPAECPVSISWHDDPGHHHDVIVNLSSGLPSFVGRFRRFVSIVVQHDQVLDYTRNHYKYLKDRGYPINNHDMRLR
ncbi:DNA polymerase III subunit chi [Thalassolituus marinus]|uniref:DNA polymerase III subunit chi n=1 Tax=Thalassolituus marinus TaxID=671053 RepID=A0ABS7ZUA1_9GAMM|nr:DNA polymerase III subunit chi [Thalassolituus marinus]MCA6065336.1 DNA polymerase III subunit chi [Thalassolituus marinus]